jgi:plastocyanin
MLGLPLHPLIVHVAVILVPLAALASLVVCFREEWRRRFGAALAVLTLASAVVTVVAVRSGGELKGNVVRSAAEAGVSARFGSHPDYGQATQISALALAGAAGALWFASRPRLRPQLPRWWATASYVAIAFPAVSALVAVGLAGHSGARLVWRDLGSFPPGKVAALTGENPPSGSASPQIQDIPAGAITVRLREFRYEPVVIEAGPGASVVLQVVNEGRVFHTLTVPEVKADTRSLWPASSSPLTFTAPDQPGTYRFLCTEEGHEEEGMVGELIVK